MQMAWNQNTGQPRVNIPTLYQVLGSPYKKILVERNIIGNKHFLFWEASMQHCDVQESQEPQVWPFSVST